MPAKNNKEKGFFEKLFSFMGSKDEKKFVKRPVAKDAGNYKDEMAQLDDTPKLGAEKIDFNRALLKAIQADYTLMK